METMQNAASTKTCLVLFTNYFPFHRGEEYLEDELPYLGANFERVIVVPVMFESTMVCTKELPDNVEVVAVEMPSGMGAKVRYIVRGLFRAQFWRYVPLSVRFLRHPIQWAYEEYFTARGIEFWCRARKHLKCAIGTDQIITVYAYWLYITAFLGLLLREEYKSQVQSVVSRAHGYDVFRHRSVLSYLPQRTLFLRELDAIYPVSQAGKDELTQINPNHRAKISVRRLGVCGGKTEQRQQLDTLRIVSCSSLQSVKRLPFLVQCLAALSKMEVSFHWTHFGGATDEISELDGLAVKHLPPGSWQFHGHVANSVIKEFYNSAPVSVFINVSASEGIAVSIMEAMAAAVPVLATAVGGTSEIVKSGVTGWLVPVEASAEAVAQELAMISHLDQREYAQVSRNAHEHWQEYWNSNNNYSNFAVRLRGGK